MLPPERGDPERSDRGDPGSAFRISDTRVLRVPAVTRCGRALSVAKDMAERPVHDRSPSAIEHMCDRRGCAGVVPARSAIIVMPLPES